MAIIMLLFVNHSHSIKHNKTANGVDEYSLLEYSNFDTSFIKIVKIIETSNDSVHFQEKQIVRILSIKIVTIFFQSSLHTYFSLFFHSGIL